MKIQFLNILLGICVHMWMYVYIKITSTLFYATDSSLKGQNGYYTSFRRTHMMEHSHPLINRWTFYGNREQGQINWSKLWCWMHKKCNALWTQLVGSHQLHKVFTVIDFLFVYVLESLDCDLHTCSHLLITNTTLSFSVWKIIYL